MLPSKVALSRDLICFVRAADLDLRGVTHGVMDVRV